MTRMLFSYVNRRKTLQKFPPAGRVGEEVPLPTNRIVQDLRVTRALYPDFVFRLLLHTNVYLGNFSTKR